MKKGFDAGKAVVRSLAHSMLVVLMVLMPALSHAGTTYVYDDLGRVIQATNTDGTATLYQYDANGNITSIKRLPAASLAISGFSPTSVHAGSSLVIAGMGFGATPTDNAVTIGGATCTVTAATASSLTVLVPQDANTGVITVTVAGNTASSSRSVNILRPVVSGLSVTLVNPGASVTLSGANLDLVPGSTTLNVGGTAATITSVSNSSIVFTAPNTPGLVQVVTPYGQATSSSALTVLPASINVANVVAYASASPGGSAASLNVNQANKYGVLSFNATQGAFLSVQLSSLTITPSNTGYSFQVLSPTSTVIASGVISPSSPSIHLPAIPTTGTYVVTFISGSATAQFNATVEVNPIINQSGSVPNVTTALSQSKRFIVTATAGQHFAVGITSFATTPSNVGTMTVSVYRPDGVQLWSRTCQAWDPLGSCGLQFIDLPLTGSYAVYASPNGAAVSLSFNLTITQPITGTLTPGAPQSISTSLPGQFNMWGFAATAGQTFAVHVGSISTTPANVNMYIAIYNPSGVSILNQSTTSGAVFNLTNLSAGTYRVLVVPYFAVTGSATITLASGVTGTVPVDGSTTTFTTGAKGQNAYLTFNATAGDDIGIGITNLVTSPQSIGIGVTVYAPNGAVVTSRTCTPWDPLGSCGLQAIDVPQTGTYQVYLSPNNSLQTMTFKITLSQAVAATLTRGTPLSVASTTPGQFTLLSFTVAANDPVVVSVGPSATTPANQNTYIAILNSSTVSLTSQSTTNSATFNLNTLAAGTYRVFWVPYFAISGTSQITLVSNAATPVNIDDSTHHYSTSAAGQAATFTFSANTGDDVGIGLTHLVPTPSSATSIDFSLYAPNGSKVWGRPCYSTDPVGSCGLQFVDLAQTGTYKLVATPQGSATLSFDLSLSHPITGTLSAGTPQTLTTTLPSQFVMLDFPGTSGHTATVALTSVSTVPSNVNTYAAIYNPAGSSITNQSSTGNMTFNVATSTGTYRVIWVPYFGVTGTVTYTYTTN